jgi:hypothetical protein
LHHFLIVGSLKTAGSPNFNEAYKYVKPEAEDLMKKRAFCSLFHGKTPQNYRLTVKRSFLHVKKRLSMEA